MDFPIYDESDAKFASQDGNSEVVEFSEFISQFIDQDVLENQVERGVISFVNSRALQHCPQSKQKC